MENSDGRFRPGWLAVVCMRISSVAVALAISIFLMSGECLAFPPDADWIPIFQNKAVKQDPNGDSNGSKNVVSDGTHSTTFIANDGTYLYLRLRMDDDPSGVGGQGELRSFGWGVEFDTNMDDSDYEWLLLVDGISNPEEIKLGQNTVQSTAGDPSDVPESYPLTIPVVGNYQVTPADTSFNNDQDYFLSWRISLADFKAATGITDSTPIRIFEGSSSSANTLTSNGADYVAGDTLQDGFSDYLTLSGHALTSGTVKFVDDGSGKGDATQAEPGGVLYVRVDDADLNTSISTVQSITVTVTSPSGESETITLTETDVNTGVFVGQVSTQQGAGPGVDNDGTLVVADGDSVQVSYLDQATDTATQATVTDTINIQEPSPGTDGAVSISSSSDNPGDDITVTVTDADLNTDSNTIEAVTVSVENRDTGEIEEVTCVETGPDTGVFTQTFPSSYSTAAGADNDGTILAEGGDEIRVTYVDQRDSNDNQVNVTADLGMVDTENSLQIDGPTGTKNTDTLDVTGTTDPLSTVTMQDPVTGLLLTTTADASGNFTFSNVEFPQGTKTYSVTSTDPSGNSVTSVASVKIDSTNTITVDEPVPGSVISTYTTDITGTTDPGSTVTMVEPGTGNTITTTADSSGNYSFEDVSLIAGNNNISLTSTDPYGNTATTSTTVTVNDSIALSVTSVANGATYNSVTHKIAGKTDPNSTVTTLDPATGALLTTVADAAGNYTFGNLTFPEGSVSQTVNAIDPAGNSVSSTVSFTIDTTNTNTITTAAVSTDSYVDITGTTDPLSTVTLVHPVTGDTFTTTADAAGAYAFEDVFLPDDTHTVTTTSTDPAGNVAVDTLDIEIVTENTINSTLAPGNSVANTSPLPISGTTTPGSTVTVNDPVLGTTHQAVADASGNFSFAGVTLAAGQNTITIVSTDPNGVTASQTSNVTYDLNISLDVQDPVIGDVSLSAEQTISGKTIPNATVTMFDPVTNELLSTSADAAGNYSFTNVTFSQGSTTVTVTAKDGFGNTASTSNTFIVATSGEDATVSSSVNTVLGEPVFIEVSDPETYLDPNEIDTIQATVSSQTTGDSEVRTLVETGPNTGIFRGSVDTVDDPNPEPGDLNDGVLAVQYGDTVTTTFKDPIQSDGTLNTQVLGSTKITNDGLKIYVNLATVTGTGSATRELSSTSISIIEYDEDGDLTGNTFNYTTDGAGIIPAEFIGRMRDDHSYRVLINDPVDGYPYSQSESFTLDDLESAPVDSSGVRIYSLLLDPAGFVYDALTGTRINGADITLYHQDGSQVAGPFTIFTQDPASQQTNPQQSGDAGFPGGFEFIGSTDLTAGYYYITVTYETDTALGGQGDSLASTYYTVQFTSGSWSGISEPYGGQLFRVDQHNQPIGMRVPLYRRSASGLILISKDVDRDFAAPGDIVTFTVTVGNPGGSQTDANNPVVVRDAIPGGMKYIPGSAYLDDGTAAQVSSESDGTMLFTIGRLGAAGAANGSDSATISYMAAIDSSAVPGMVLTNTAAATIDSIVVSGAAHASVRVIDDPIMDRATLIGRVFIDDNRNGRYDRGEKGVGGVGIVLEDGTYVTTGPLGRYSVPGADTGLETTGTRVVKLDMDCFPYGTEATTPVSAFATLRPGDIDKVNFGVVLPAELRQVEDGGSEEETPDHGESFRKLFAALAEGVAGKFDSATAFRPDREYFPGGPFARGRFAYFYRKIDGKQLSITSSYDSHKNHTYDIFSDRDRDRYYPTYGDGSSVKYLAETQGRFYLEAETRHAGLLVGNYDLRFSRTELAGIRRTLSGVKFDFDWGNDEKTGGGSHFLAFSTRREQLHARSELRSHGGTTYYLASSKIVTGSERIIVQVRDSIVPEKVNYQRELVKDGDYEIDYISGRVRLFRPVATYSESDTIYHYDIQSGDPVWIVAEYSYEPRENDYGSYGARLVHQTRHGFALGGSYVRENLDGDDHRLGSVDLHIGPEGEETAVIEYARSDSGGMPRMASYDGGRSFFTLGSRNATSGDAFSAKLNIRGIDKIEWENYYYLVDPDFTGYAYGERGIRRAGTSIAYKTGPGRWKADYTRAYSLTGAAPDAVLYSGGGRTRTFRLGYEESNATRTIAFEYMRDYNSGGAGVAGTNMREDGVDSYSARYERQLDEKLKILFEQQLTFVARQHHRTRVGVEYAVSSRLSLKAEAMAGTAGGGGRIGFERSAGSGSKAYVSVGVGRAPGTSARETRTTAGYSKKVSDKSDVYLQYENRSADGENISGRTLGLNHRMQVSRRLAMSVSAERSEERSSFSSRYFTNSAALAAGYDKSRTAVEASAEFRDRQGSDHTHFFGFRIAADTPLRKELDSFSEYVYEVSDDINAGRADTKYTKFLAGLAWRPPSADRLNVLARAGRVRELRAVPANNAVNPDTLATVMSLEGMLELSHEFTLRGKTASKISRARTSGGASAKVRTLLNIGGIEWKPSKKWYFRGEYRTRRQPSQLNHRDGVLVEAGRYVNDALRIGAGYNFSSYSDDEFTLREHSFRGFFFTIAGKM